MKKQFKFLIFGLISLMLFGCFNERPPKKEDADAVLQKKTEETMKEAIKQIGMPSVINFQEKKFLKMIYELCDQENVICYAYFFNERTGKVGDFIGKCYGYGIPYSTQFSNPERVAKNHFSHTYGHIWGTLPQAEPNGLFKPEGLSATWLIMVGPEGKPRPMYVEPLLIVSPYPLHESKEK